MPPSGFLSLFITEMLQVEAQKALRWKNWAHRSGKCLHYRSSQWRLCKLHPFHQKIFSISRTFSFSHFFRLCLFGDVLPLSASFAFYWFIYLFLLRFPVFIEHHSQTHLLSGTSILLCYWSSNLGDTPPFLYPPHSIWFSRSWRKWA
jgi:hypothetical protein